MRDHEWRGATTARARTGTGNLGKCLLTSLVWEVLLRTQCTNGGVFKRSGECARHFRKVFSSYGARSFHLPPPPYFGGDSRSFRKFSGKTAAKKLY